jgi:ABC-type multidrug transport system ATPase subunit
MYCDTDIQIFDVQKISVSLFFLLGTDHLNQDPLSALDAHVGKDVFNNVLHDRSTGKTRILVTHALHFLPQVDLIITIVDGHIAERGTYAELMANNGEFSKFVTEFGSKDDTNSDDESTIDDAKDGKKGETKHDGISNPMMQAEERNTGAITRAVYREYLRAGNGIIAIPLLLISLVFIQGATVMSSYW